VLLELTKKAIPIVKTIGATSHLVCCSYSVYLEYFTHWRY